MTDYEQLISNLAQLKLNNFSENYQNYSTEVDQQRLSFGEALLKLTESEPISLFVYFSSPED